MSSSDNDQIKEETKTNFDQTSTKNNSSSSRSSKSNSTIGVASIKVITNK